jgi:hypothetical protein
MNWMFESVTQVLHALTAAVPAELRGLRCPLLSGSLSDFFEYPLRLAKSGAVYGDRQKPLGSGGRAKPLSPRMVDSDPEPALAGGPCHNRNEAFRVPKTKRNITETIAKTATYGRSYRLLACLVGE